MTTGQDHAQLASDAELITRVRAGDRTAYGDLYLRHSAAATSLARQVARSAAEADDLVSEAFARVLDNLLDGRGPDTAFRAYLFTTVRNTAVDRSRRDKKVQFTDTIESHDTAVVADDPVLANLENGLVARAFAGLPERWQTVLWHTQVEGQSAAEVAVLLGMTPNAVSSLAFRAKEGLRAAYLQAHLAETQAATCRTTVGRLGAWTRGGLSKRETAQVDEHLDVCEDCRALAAELKEINGGLRALLAPLLLGGAAAGYLATLPPVAPLMALGPLAEPGALALVPAQGAPLAGTGTTAPAAAGGQVAAAGSPVAAAGSPVAPSTAGGAPAATPPPGASTLVKTGIVAGVAAGIVAVVVAAVLLFGGDPEPPAAGGTSPVATSSPGPAGGGSGAPGAGTSGGTEGGTPGDTGTDEPGTDDPGAGEPGSEDVSTEAPGGGIAGGSGQGVGNGVLPPVAGPPSPGEEPAPPGGDGSTGTARPQTTPPAQPAQPGPTTQPATPPPATQPPSTDPVGTGPVPSTDPVPKPTAPGPTAPGPTEPGPIAPEPPAGPADATVDGEPSLSGPLLAGSGVTVSVPIANAHPTATLPAGQIVRVAIPGDQPGVTFQPDTGLRRSQTALMSDRAVCLPAGRTMDCTLPAIGPGASVPVSFGLLTSARTPGKAEVTVEIVGGPTRSLGFDVGSPVSGLTISGAAGAELAGDAVNRVVLTAVLGPGGDGGDLVIPFRLGGGMTIAETPAGCTMVPGAFHCPAGALADGLPLLLYLDAGTTGTIEATITDQGGRPVVLTATAPVVSSAGGYTEIVAIGPDTPLGSGITTALTLIAHPASPNVVPGPISVPLTLSPGIVLTGPFPDGCATDPGEVTLTCTPGPTGPASWTLSVSIASGAPPTSILEGGTVAAATAGSLSTPIVLSLGELTVDPGLPSVSPVGAQLTGTLVPGGTATLTVTATTAPGVLSAGPVAVTPLVPAGVHLTSPAECTADGGGWSCTTVTGQNAWVFQVAVDAGAGSGAIVFAPAVTAGGVSVPVSVAGQDLVVRPQASPGCPPLSALRNGDFSYPVVGNSWTMVHQDTPGVVWRTEPKVPTGDSSRDDVIEFWRDATRSDGQFVELNSHQESTLYQDVTTVPGTTMSWSIKHLGRNGPDTMHVLIGTANGLVVQAATTDQGATVTDITTGNDGWRTYSGTYTVPAGQTSTRFAFQAVSSHGGRLNEGNFLSDVVFQFDQPACLDATIATGPGGTVTLTATNQGTASATEVTLSAYLTPGVTVTIPTEAGISGVDGPVATIPLPAIASGETVTVVLSTAESEIPAGVSPLVHAVWAYRSGDEKQLLHSVTSTVSLTAAP